MSGSTLNVTMPAPEFPFVGPDGRLTRQGYYFLLGIFQRTGGNVPIIPTHLQDQINALFVEEAFNDLEMPVVSAAIIAFLADAMALEHPPVNVAFPVMMGQALIDPAPVVALNPFLAALVVCD